MRDVSHLNLQFISGYEMLSFYFLGIWHRLERGIVWGATDPSTRSPKGERAGVRGRVRDAKGRPEGAGLAAGETERQRTPKPARPLVGAGF